MEKAIIAAKFIARNLKDNHSEYLDDLNLKSVFEGIYNLGFPPVDENRLIAFIIFAYDPDSQKLDIRKDRYENKSHIMEGLGLDTSNELIHEILTNSNEKFNNVVLEYLKTLTNWRWPTIFSLLDYHSNMIRFATQKTEAEKTWDKMNKEGEVKSLSSDYSIDTIAKVNIQKSDIFDRAISAREKADKLLDDIRKEFLNVDAVTQQDFGFNFTDTAKKRVDILSWRAYIKGLKDS